MRQEKMFQADAWATTVKRFNIAGVCELRESRAKQQKQ